MVQKIRFALIGCGLFGEKSLMPAFKTATNAELVALTKRNADDAESTASKWGIPEGFAMADLDAVLHRTDIDAVYLATPNNQHKAEALAAFRAGKHVIVEKPMAMNRGECAEMIAAARAAQKKLMIAHCFRYNSTVRYFQTMIESGKLGTLVQLTADFYSNASVSQRKWKFARSVAGGGAAFDLGVHLIDTIRFLHPGPVQSVQCVRKPDPIPEDQMDLLASYLLRFEDGVVGRATSTYEGPRTLFLEALGTKGTLRAFDWNPINTDVRVDQILGDKPSSVIIKNADHYRLEIEAFADAILHDTPSPVSGEEGLENQRYLDMIYQ